jgi:hypothetical protein
MMKDYHKTTEVSAGFITISASFWIIAGWRIFQSGPFKHSPPGYPNHACSFEKCLSSF